MTIPTVTEVPLPSGQFYTDVVAKGQLYAHHTAGSSSPYGSIGWWASNKERVGTAFCIGGKGGTKAKRPWKDGEVCRAFPSNRWAYHLGVKTEQLPHGSISTHQLNAGSIGVELCGWGSLTLSATGFTSYTGEVVPDSDVVALNYRGLSYWQTYTDAQLTSCRTVLRYLCDTYDIDHSFKGMGIFELDDRAFKGERGIFCHSSVRADKTDCFPQTEFVQMLASL